MSFRKPIRRTRSGRFQITLGAPERAVLASLAPQLRELLAEPDQAVLYRLFPPAYSSTDHDSHEEEYRRLMQEDLVERHGAALDVLAATSGAEELDLEQLEAWMRALNHLRLVLGTRLDVSDNDDDLAPSDTEHQVYRLLGYLQECVVEALSTT